MTLTSPELIFTAKFNGVLESGEIFKRLREIGRLLTDFRENFREKFQTEKSIWIRRYV